MNDQKYKKYRVIIRLGSENVIFVKKIHIIQELSTSKKHDIDSAQAQNTGYDIRTTR